MGHPEPQTPLPRNIWILTLTSFLTDISSEMVLNVLPLFLSNVLGTPTSIIGLIEGVAETTASLLKWVSGWLSDKWQRRKWLTIMGYGISTVVKPFLYLAASWATVLAVRFSDRVGKGIRTAPRDALIADSIDEKQRGRAFGLHRAGDTSGAVVGLTIALVVVGLSQQQSDLLQRSTFQWLVILSIIPAALAVVALIIGIHEPPRPPRPKRESPPRLGWRDLNPRFRGFLVIVVLFALGNSADGFLILRAQHVGLSVLGVLGMLIVFNGVYAAFSRSMGALSDRIGRTRLIIGGWSIYAGVYLGFAVANAVWQIWLLVACYGLYYAAVEGTAKALIADLVEKSQRGTAYGFYNAAAGLSALPASIIAGLLWQYVGVGVPFLFGAALAAVAVALMLRWSQQAEVAQALG